MKEEKMHQRVESKECYLEMKGRIEKISTPILNYATIIIQTNGLAIPTPITNV